MQDEIIALHTKFLHETTDLRNKWLQITLTTFHFCLPILKNKKTKNYKYNY